MSSRSRSAKNQRRSPAQSEVRPHRCLLWVAKHRSATLAGLVSLLLSLAYLGIPILTELQTSGQDMLAKDSESTQVSNFLAQAGVSAPGQLLLVLVHLEPQGRQAIRHRVLAAQRKFAEVPNVTATKSFFGITSSKGGLQQLETKDRRLLTENQEWAAIVGLLGAGANGNTAVAASVRQLFDKPGYLLAGELPRLEETDKAIAEDLRRGDLLALPLLILVLLWAFKRWTLVVLPLATAAFTLLATLVMIRVLHGAGVQFSLLGAAPVAGIALGMSVDYSLLLVGRCREAASSTSDTVLAVDKGTRAIAPTIATCVSSIAFAVAPLSLTQIPAVSSLSIACACCVLIAGLAAVSIAPIGLLLLRSPSTGGKRSNVSAPSANESRFWLRVPSWAMRRPQLAMALGLGILGLLSIPALSLRAGSIPPAEVLPGTPTAKAEGLLESRFPRSLTNERISIVLEAPASAVGTSTDRTIKAIKASTGVKSVTAATPLSSTLSMLEVQSTFPRESSEAMSLVRRLRNLPEPPAIFVSSSSADTLDRERSIQARIIPVLAASLAGIALVLFMMGGSFAVPIKLIFLTALTMTATFGVVAFVFQGGHAESSKTVFDSTQILTLAVLGAALVTDYGVFVTARIVENHEAGLADEEAISRGLAATGPVVSTAAVVFAVAVGSFLLSDISLIKQVCVGLIAAVLIDALLVRAILVPAVMKVMGPLNWWLPKPVEHFHKWLAR